MLTLFKFFANVGQLNSVTGGATIPLKKMTAVYAENGRGKTTLSAIFRSLATNDPLSINERHRLGAAAQPHIVIECTGGPPPAIFQNGARNRHLRTLRSLTTHSSIKIFAQELAIGSGHRQSLHELILGSQGVALNDTLQNHVANIENLYPVIA